MDDPPCSALILSPFPSPLLFLRVLDAISAEYGATIAHRAQFPAAARAAPVFCR